VSPQAQPRAAEAIQVTGPGRELGSGPRPGRGQSSVRVAGDLGTWRGLRGGKGATRRGKRRGWSADDEWCDTTGVGMGRLGRMLTSGVPPTQGFWSDGHTMDHGVGRPVPAPAVSRQVARLGGRVTYGGARVKQDQAEGGRAASSAEFPGLPAIHSARPRGK